MTNTVKRFDAYFTFDGLTSEQQGTIRKLMDAQGLDIDLFEDTLEFNFEGRDLSDQVVEAFAKIALTIHEATGEMRCEIDDDKCLDPTFEFYTIADSRLWRQSGRIVRETQKHVVK